MMTIDTLNFNGDATTFIGLVGITITAIIVVAVFRSYWFSPYRK